jgi:hypothetical protein
MASSDDIAWAAGLFEGEGSIGVYPVPRRVNSIRTTLSMCMVDYDVLERFHSIVGAGSLLGPYEGQREGYQIKWIWQTMNARDCLFVLGQLYPYLCSRRKEKADDFFANVVDHYNYSVRWRGMRVLVCGGRDYDDWVDFGQQMYHHLYDGDHTNLKDHTIISGAARGADRLAIKWAILHGVDYEAYPADWEKYPKAAGPIRNQQMLDTGIDLVIAFPGGSGTADMVRRAKKAGVKVIDV